MSKEINDNELTPQQLKQWNDYSCTSRALMKLSSLAGRPLTTQGFCKQFAYLFPNPKDRYGILDDNAAREIIKELALGSPVGCQDYSEVQRQFAVEGRKVLLISHVSLHPGETNEINHCSVLTGIDDNGFSIWSSSQGGGEFSMNFVKADWKEKQFSGIVLI